MIRILGWALVPVVLLGLAGCQGTAKTVHCTACNQDVKVGTYCPKCEKLIGQEGTVHCDKCNKDIAAGQYCAKCNRIMLPGTVKCCGQEVPKGSYCEKCKGYAGVKNVGYCEKCKAPYDKSTGCAACKKKAT